MSSLKFSAFLFYIDNKYINKNRYISNIIYSVSIGNLLSLTGFKEIDQAFILQQMQRPCIRNRRPGRRPGPRDCYVGVLSESANHEMNCRMRRGLPKHISPAAHNGRRSVGWRSEK